MQYITTRERGPGKPDLFFVRDGSGRIAERWEQVYVSKPDELGFVYTRYKVTGYRDVANM